MKKSRNIILFLIIVAIMIIAMIGCDNNENNQFKSFDVTFYVNDEVYATVTVDSIDFDISKNMPAIPTKADDENGSYQFSYWQYEDGNIFDENAIITGAINLYAVFELVPHSYTVEFIDWDGTYLLVDGRPTQSVVAGQSAKAPQDPEREGYTFVGWDRAFDNITKRTTVNALYEINSYTLTFKSFGDVVESVDVEYNAKISDYMPSLDSIEGLSFVEWQSTQASVEDNMPAQNIEFEAKWQIKPASLQIACNQIGIEIKTEYKQGITYSLSFDELEGFDYSIQWYLDNTLQDETSKAFITTNIGAGKHTIYAQLNIAYDDLQNVVVKSQTMDFEILPADLMVKTLDKTIVYGEDCPQSFEYTIEGFADGEDESVLKGHIEFSVDYQKGYDANINGYDVITSGFENANYSISYSIAKLYVNKKNLSVTPQDISVQYGDEVLEYQYEIDGIADCDTLQSLGEVVFASDYLAGSPVGDYTIKATQGFDGQKAGNYNIQYNTANLSVLKKSIEVGLKPIQNLTFGDEKPSFELVVPELVADDTIQDLGSYSIECNYSRYSKIGEYTANVVFDKASQNYIVKSSGVIAFDVLPKTIKFYGSETHKNGQGTNWSTDNITAYFQELPSEFTASGKFGIKTDVQGTYTTNEDGTLGENFEWLEPLNITYNDDDYTQCFVVIYDFELTLNNSFSSQEVIFNGDYDGQEHSSYVNLQDATENTIVEYSYNGNEWSQSAPAFVNAGIYVVDYRIQNNNVVMSTGQIEVVINKVNNTIDTSNITQEEKTYTYNGSAQKVTFANVSAYENAEISYLNNTFTDVPQEGVLTVQIITAETTNYLPTTSYVEVVVNKANYTSAPQKEIEVFVEHNKTLAQFDAPSNYTWEQSQENLSIIPKAGDNVVKAWYNADPKNYNSCLTDVVIKGQKTKIQIITSDIQEVVVGNTWTPTDITFSKNGIDIDFDLAVTQNGIVDTSYGTTYEVTYTLNDNEYYVADAKTIYVKVKSILHNGTYYTIEDALDKISSGTMIVAQNTSFASAQIGKAIYSYASAYILKNGVMLMVPYSDAHDTDTQANTTAVVGTIVNNAFATLTVPSGINLICDNSHIYVAALRNAGNTGSNTGSVNGSNYGALNIQKNASITMNGSGSVFESLGYTYGEGDLYVNAGSIYEPIILSGYKGGSITRAINGTVFPINQYSVINIVVNMHIDSSVIYYIKSIMTMRDDDVITSDIQYIANNDNAFIRVESGKLIKSYNSSNGVVGFAFEGNIEIKDMTLEVATSIAKVEVSTEGSQVPFTGAYDFVVKDGSNVDVQSGVKFLPGSSLMIEQGATVNLYGNMFVYSNDSKVVYDKSNRYSETPYVEGWQDGGYNMAYPANSNIYLWDRPVIDYNKDTPATFSIAGTLNIMSGASAAGRIIALDGGKVIIESGANTSFTIKEDYTNYNDNTKLPITGKVISVKARYFTATNSLLGQVNGIADTNLDAGKTYVGDSNGNWVVQ